MANLKITDKDGRVFEVSDISFDEVKQLVLHSNGNGYSRANGAPSKLLGAAKPSPDYAKFKAALSEHAKKFFRVLSENHSGISADHLCEKLGFNSTNQIGGVTGGGVSKLANRFHISLEDLYQVEKKYDNGERRVSYKPGPEIEKVS